MTEHELARALAKAEELISMSDRGLLHSGMKDVVLLARAHLELARKVKDLQEAYWNAMELGVIKMISSRQARRK